MKRSNFLLLAFLCLLCGCFGSSAINTWKNKTVRPRTYNKILVVGITRQSDIEVARRVEDHFVQVLNDIGYHAVSSIKEFGPKGLANMEQAATYKILGEKGIDAVITMALLEQKTRQYVPAKVKYYSSLYYYNRIFSYKTLLADSTKADAAHFSSSPYFWESIFFDIVTLSPVYTAQTKPFNRTTSEAQTEEFGKMIIANMIKNKIFIWSGKAQRKSN